MAYDRYETRDGPRDERSRWSEGRDFERGRERDWGRENRDRQGGSDERGFFERAGDEISSWFRDDEAERRRREERMPNDDDRGYFSTRDREHGHAGDRDREREHGHGWNRDRERHRDRDWNENRGAFARGGSSERDYNRRWQADLGGGADRDRRDRDRSYRPVTGDYGRSHESDQFFAASGVGGGDRGVGEYDRSDRDRSDSMWGRDPYRSASRAGTSDRSDRSRHDRDFDPHYRSWRDRQLSELDRDYDDYRRESRSRFESDFGSWRERRQQKRGLLGQIREQMEVLGSDDENVGTVDRVAGDRLILTKSDADSGGAHHSLSCSDIDRVDGNRVILDCTADEAQNRWRDENRSRALFEREDQGEMGPRSLNRSFEGTYR